jgi:ABC-type multidrug transport system fused ATPase/permease subunit
MKNYIKNIIRVLPPKTINKLFPLLLLIFIGTILETFGVWVILPVFNLFKQSNIELSFIGLKFTPASYGINTEFKMAIFILTFFLLFYLLKTLFLSYLAHSQNKFAYSIQTDLAYNLFKNYLKKPWPFHLENNSALLTRNILIETSVLTSNALLPAMLLLTEAFAIIGIGILLITIEPLGSLITFLSLGFVAFVFNFFTKKMINKWGHSRQFHEGKRMQHLQQGLGGVKEVLLLGKELYFINAFNNHNVKGANANQNQITLQQLPRLFIELFAIFTLSILILVLIYFNKPLDEILPVLGIFSLAAFRLMPSISRVMNANQSIRFVLPALSILKSDINYTQFVEQKEKIHLKFKNEIVLENINFSYNNQTKESIKELNIKIQPGDSIGIIGTSGAGKSTLVDIIIGLLEPTKGTIRVDGINIQNNLKSWYKLIGYVPQSIFLTDDTIKNNIAFGLIDEEIDITALNSAITAAQLSDFIQSLPNGIETIVGERGARISGGQRQRIAIARALYHNPEILVFDEATSALDDDTEQCVMNTINNLMNSKTLIIVTHKLQTVSKCNKVYKIDNGVIKEA